MASHFWIRADHRRDRDLARGTLGLPPTLAVVDAHRFHRGPFTAAGSVLRAVGRDALRRLPELGPRHHIEILTAAPEFADAVPPIKATLDLTTDDFGVRTRYQARVHTLRVAHGLVELLRDYCAALGDGARAVVVENAHEADPTDREFIAVLLSRLPPSQVTVVVGTDTRPIADPPGPASASMVEALTSYATVVDGDRSPGPDPSVDPSTVAEDARAYVASDGTSDDPRHHAAYQLLPPSTRASLHDERAAALTVRGEPSLLLGAVPYHAERGSDPSGAGVAAIREAQVRCKDLGLFYAAAELGARGRRLVDREQRPELWWDLTGDMTTSLTASGRGEEAEAYYYELRTLTTDAALQMHLAYGTAMLYARHYPEERRDPKQARAWLNLAVALSSRLPNPKERAFYTSFNHNGIALVDVREGRFEDAIRRLSEGMARLDRELEPGDYLLHRTGLRYNRAQVYLMSGQLQEALADFDYAVAQDPNFRDNYFNRGNVLNRLGRYEEAIADYDHALQLSPPFPEAYYNRGDTRLELGDAEGALADFGRVIELDPGNVDARVNRAGILCDLGEPEAAWAEVADGLAIDETNAQLWCAKGRLLADRGDGDAARDALETALGIDDQLAEAYAIRGMLAFQAGNPDAAVDDLTRAVELRTDPAIRFNRGVAYHAAGRFAEAVDDFEAVLGQTGDPDARRRRDACLAAVDRIGV
jgi:tetratricopeptide (TPR) repeat protein